MTSPLTDPELRAAEEAWEEELARAVWCWDDKPIFLAGYAAALRASPMGEAEREIVEAACAHRHALMVLWSPETHADVIRIMRAESERMAKAVDALLALRATTARGSEPAGEA